MKKIWMVSKRNMQYVLRKMRQIKKRTLFVYVCLSLIISVLPVFVSLIQKDIVDYLVDCSSGGAKQWYKFGRYCIVMGILLLALAMCEVWVQYINNVSSLRYKRVGMLENVDKMAALKMEQLENPKVHFLFDLSCEEPNVNPLSIIRPALKILATVIMAASYYVILLQLNIVIAILPIVIAIPLVKIGNKKEFYEYQSKYDSEIMDLNRRISYFSSIVKEPLYAKDNTIYNVGSYFLKKRESYKNEIISKKMRFIRKIVGITILVSFITLLTQYGVYLLLGIKVLHKSITLGSLNLYFNAFTVILLSLNQVIDNASYINAQVGLEDAKEEFMRLPVIDMSSTNHSRTGRCKHKISFENVSFAYPGTDKNIIENLSLSIDEEDVVALIGENGSGKSTLIKLLIGQYEPQSGTIMIDGVDIAEYSSKELASIYGVMFQNVAHVAISIREFVSLSQEAVDEKRFYEALEKAGCETIVENAVAHSETKMGLSLDYENAKEFSGGEWQRFAMARLFYASPDVFVMDEPTASLDAEAEYHFFENLNLVGKQHQIIMVSHRLSIARLSTKVVFFGKDGITIDTHNNLMNKVPSYRAMYEMQRSLYFDAEG